MYLKVVYHPSYYSKPKKTIQLHHVKYETRSCVEIPKEFMQERFSVIRDVFCKEHDKELKSLWELHRSTLDCNDAEHVLEVKEQLSEARHRIENLLISKIKQEFPQVFV